jgi:formate dehydrogenase major subunit
MVLGLNMSRRAFLKLSGTAGLVGSFYLLFGYDPQESLAAICDEAPALVWGKEVPTVCCYCSVGCGALCLVENHEVVGIIGDPDNPINEGALCSKGSSLLNLRNIYDRDIGKRVLNPKRMTEVLYRAPYSKTWRTVSWDWALGEIAKRVKATRDATFEKTDDKGVTVNRTKAIAHFGSAALDNEENYVLHKMQRALGVINIDHHARL